MRLTYKLSAAILAFFCACVYAYPSGVPLNRCGSMLPKHDATPLKDSPYYIKAVKSGDVYNGNFEKNSKKILK